MSTTRHWPLGAKLSLVAAPFLLLAIGSIAVLVWMSLRLEGGAAAVNEAGRMRMQAYRMVLSAVAPNSQTLAQQMTEFERSLLLLRNGDRERPLFVPWDGTVRQRFAAIAQNWLRFSVQLSAAAAPGAPARKMPKPLPLLPHLHRSSTALWPASSCVFHAGHR